MDHISLGNLAYLVLLTAMLLFWFFSDFRQNLGKTLQYVLAWGLIILGMVAVVGMWDDIKRAALPAQAVLADDGRIEIPVSADGHYYLNAELNGTPVRFVVDTGASDIVLSESDAKRVGVDLSNLRYNGRAMTANGQVRTAATLLESFAVGPYVDQNVVASITQGNMDISLLGMSYLSRYDQITITQGRLVLTR